MNCWVILERPARPEGGDLEVTPPPPHPVSLVWIMWSEAGLNISHKMGPGESGGQLRDLATSRRGLLRADFPGPLTSGCVEGGRRLRDAERPLPASRIAAIQSEARSCSWRRQNV